MPQPEVTEVEVLGRVEPIDQPLSVGGREAVESPGPFEPPVSSEGSEPYTSVMSPFGAFGSDGT
jgi:hypothetical protein